MADQARHRPLPTHPTRRVPPLNTSRALSPSQQSTQVGARNRNRHERHRRTSNSLSPLPMGDTGSGRGNALVRRPRELPARYRQYYPSLEAPIPPTERRRIALGLVNLLFDDEHPRLEYEHVDERVQSADERVLVDGFINICFDLTNKPSPDTADPFVFLMPGTTQLPKDFGNVPFGDDHLGRAIYHFFIHNVSPKRTLIYADNMYLRAVCAMAMSNDLVKTAMLDLPPTYLLDYVDNPDIRSAARRYHRQTLKLFRDAQAHFEANDPGTWREDDVSAFLIAVVLLMHNHEINWQAQAPKDKNPAWYRYGKFASWIAKESDPTRRYRDPAAVQFRETWFGAGQIICLDLAFSDAFFPLDQELNNSPPPWICHGTDDERRKIFGMNGLSPQLMYYYLNITFQSAAMSRGGNTVTPLRILEQTLLSLESLSQWSDISKGGTVDEIWKVDDSKVPSLEGHVTDVIGACYVEACGIYVRARGLRLPREHTNIQMSLQRLLRMIHWQPTGGQLFTAQTPLFAVFVAGVVAYRPQDRLDVERWFKGTMDGSRGNVKPLWAVMRTLWRWQDASANFNETWDNNPFTNYPWWEDMVEALVNGFGRLNLA